MTIQEFIGDEVIYDNTKVYYTRHGYKIPFLNLKVQQILQNVFGEGHKQEAIKFQDELGQFIVDAINEKLKRTP